jgi:hypothetical protein
LKRNYNGNGNFIFATLSIVILLVYPCIAEVSFGQTTQYSTPSVLPSSASSSTNPSLIHITAGKIQDISFTINNNKAPFVRTLVAILPSTLTQLAVTLASQNPAVKILGPSTWNLPNIPSGSGQKLTTQVFASTSAISTPVFFTVSIQYIQNGYLVRTTSFNLGAVVVGLIQLGVNNLNVRYIGNSPTLSGNILNQGNTGALFSTIRMLQEGQASNKNLATTLIPTSSQYLATLPPNIAVPFNIPLHVVRGVGNDANRAAYPVSLEITYTDTLRNVHNLIVNDTVNLLGIGPPIQKTAVASNALEGSNAVRISDPGQQQQLQPLPQLPFGNGFIDSYWAENIAQSTVNSGSSISSNGSFFANTLPAPPRIQAGPGYGQAILAVVLSNTAFYTIGGINGYLTLPAGFTAGTGGSGNLTTINNINQISTSSQTYREPQTAIASLPSSVQVGQTYTLFFKVDIGNTATVGSHLASLKLYYYQLPLITPGQYAVQTVSVPFNLPGTVVLDAVPKTTTLNPGVADEATIQLINRGTAAARNVVATIGAIRASNINPPTPATLNTNATTGGQIITQNPPSLIPIVNLGPSTFRVGTIPVNHTAVINPIFFPADSAGATLQNFNVTLTYIDTGGNSQTSSAAVGFQVLPKPPQAGLSIAPSGGLSVSPLNGTALPSPTPHFHSHFRFHPGNNLKNGNSASGITVSASYNIHSSKAIINNSTIDNNNNGILPAVYKVTRDSNSNNTTTTNPPSLSRLSDIASVTNSSSTNGLTQNTTSANNVVPSSHLNNTSLIITALSVQDMKFHLTNYNDFPITHLVVSISSQSGDVKIVGDNVWTIPVIPPHTSREFSTKVYASTSLIAIPVSFNVLLQYVASGQSQAGSFVLSATVIGNIIPSISGGLTISYIAGIPNIVGNLLNQGTTTGLYTTVTMVNQPFHPSNSSRAAQAGPSSNQQSSSSYSPSGLPPTQYLGDLQADSPLPFSIPLAIDINNTAPGTYPVILKISYSDDLHRPHVTYLHDSVVLASHPPLPTNSGGPLAFLGLGGGAPHVHGRHGGSGGVGIGILGIPLLIWIIIIAAIIIAIILIRRRRKSKEKLLISESAKEVIDEEGAGDDIESLIDSGKKKGGSDGESQL